MSLLAARRIAKTGAAKIRSHHKGALASVLLLVVMNQPTLTKTYKIINVTSEKIIIFCFLKIL
jgi:hypothetical protein